MGKKTLAEVEALAHKILITYFCDSDMEFMISTFADDIIWLGSGEHQKAEGREAVAAFFRSGKDHMVSCDMFDEQYHSLDLGGGSYLCEGVSRLLSKPESEIYINTQQRVTFIFRDKGGELETVHIHNSVPFADLLEDELFPVDSGRDAFKKLKSALNAKNQEYNHQSRFLEQLYETLPCGIIHLSTDPSRTIISINPMVWKLYGYSSKEEFCASITSVLQTVEPPDLDWLTSIMDQLTLNGEPAAYRRQCLKKDGEKAWISAVMGRIINSSGEEVIQAAFTDITEQMHLEQAQEQERILENRFLRAAICTAYPMIVSINLTKNMYSRFVNEQQTFYLPEKGSLTDLINYSLPLIYNSYQEDFAATFDRETLLNSFAAGEREHYMELQAKGTEGGYHWLAIHMISVENPFNDDVLTICLIKFLDELRQEQARQEQLLRDALAAAQAASQAKSDFLSRMSHDIRTPMNAIIGMSAIGQIKSDDRQTVKDCFQKIDISSKYLLSLINDILDMSRIETHKMEIAHERFHFRTFVEDINQIIYPQTLAREISYEIHHKEPIEDYYIGDPLRMKQILMNLLSNALKFTMPGGSICVDIAEAMRTDEYAYMSFIIEDNGIGMSEEFLGQIFEPFEQESPGNARNNVGSGLGLSIVYSLVQLMDGTISVTSKKHVGSRFTVTIPLQLASPDDGNEWEQKRLKLLKGFRVLVADDDPAVGKQTASILDDIGAKTTWTDSGVHAIQAVERSVAAGALFDIALIDWKMPGMDGIETARRIRRLTGPDTMIIMITAYDWNCIESEALDAGIDGYIPKPMFRSVIYDTLSKLGNKDSASSDMEEKPEPKFSLTGTRLLLVEDNELNQEIARTLLEMNGAQVDVAENGEEAIKCFQNHEPGTYQAVLMDIRMPVMDGLEAAKGIRALNRKDSASIPILAMTANAFEEDRKKAYEATMNSYLVKPLDIQILIEELEKVIK